MIYEDDSYSIDERLISSHNKLTGELNMNTQLIMALCFLSLGITYVVLSRQHNSKAYQFSGISFLLAGVFLGISQLI